MEITDIRLRKMNEEGRLKAAASITIDNVFVVHDVRVIEGERGKYISFPSRKGADGKFRDIAHPLTPEIRELIQNKVLEKYNEE